MMKTGFILAQDSGFDFESLIYIFIFVIAPVLTWIVGKYKEWQEGGKETGDVEVDSDEEVIFEVSLDDEDEFVLRPTTAKDAIPSVPSARKPVETPVPPVVIQQPRPSTPVARPVQRPPTPVARPVQPQQPVQTRQPSAPQRKQKTRQQPARQATKRRRTEVPAETPVPALMNIAGIPVRNLKDAVILSEILAPPISVRQIEGRNSGFERPDI